MQAYQPHPPRQRLLIREAENAILEEGRHATHVCQPRHAMLWMHERHKSRTAQCLFLPATECRQAGGQAVVWAGPGVGREGGGSGKEGEGKIERWQGR